VIYKLFEKYNNLATYSLCLSDIKNYVLYFALISGIIGFFISFIYCIYFSKDDDYRESFSWTFFVSIFIATMSMMGGVILGILWSPLIFYVMPLLTICFILFKGQAIKNFISKYKIKHNKNSRKIIKDTMNDLKAEELARQAWATLKKDFPQIKYETILESIKNKM
jgi:NhaP-type Na+/H+ and K+/H+ antiporter